MSVIVFAGDSITDSDRRTDRLGLGYGYVNLVAAALRDHGQHSTVVNAGVAGDRVEASARTLAGRRTRPTAVGALRLHRRE